MIFHTCGDFTFLPLEEKQVEVVVVLGEEVSQDPSRVSTADLERRQAEVDTLDKVPELSYKVLIEHPEQRRHKINP